MIFLESANNQLELKIQRLQGSTSGSTKPKERHPPTTLISDEQLEEHIEKIIDEDSSKKAKAHIVIRKKSFLARLFSR